MTVIPEPAVFSDGCCHARITCRSSVNDKARNLCWIYRIYRARWNRCPGVDDILYEDSVRLGFQCFTRFTVVSG